MKYFDLLILLILISCYSSDSLIFENGNVADLNHFELTDNQEIKDYLLSFNKDLYAYLRVPKKRLFKESFVSIDIFDKKDFKSVHEMVASFNFIVTKYNISVSRFKKGGINSQDIITDYTFTNTNLLQVLNHYPEDKINAVFQNASTGEESSLDEFEETVKELARNKNKNQ